MLRITGIDHINLNVRNLEETRRFYQQLFGFTVKKHEPEQNGLIIGNDRVALCLYEHPEKDVAENAGFNHFGFHIDNFDEVTAACRRLGVPILYGGPVQWEKSRSIYIQDPNGYTIELSERWQGGL